MTRHLGLYALNTQDTREQNLATVFEAIRRAPGRSRKEIGATMPFSLQTMTNVVQELLDMGLVEEVKRETKGTRGYPQRGLRPLADAGFALGIQLRWDSLRLVLTDLSYRIVHSAQLEIAANSDDVADYLHMAAQHTLSYIAANRDKDIWALGLAGPLPLEIPKIPAHTLDEGKSAHQVWFRNVFSKVSIDALKTHFEKTCRLPTTVLNNPQASAFAQAMHVPDDARFVHVFIGFGLGVTFVNHRRISSDIWPHGGELGHVIYQGQILNSRLSAARLLHSLRHELPEDASESDIERLWTDKPTAFDPWLHEAAPILNFLSNFVENAIWPDTITVGGFLPPSLLEALVTHTYPLYDSVVMATDDARRSLPRLVRADQDARAIPWGAAASVFSAAQNPGFAKLIAARRARKMDKGRG